MQFFLISSRKICNFNFSSNINTSHSLNFCLFNCWFWLFFGGHCTGGLLLSALATTSTILDHYLRRINAGFAIGFTSVLIIVSTSNFRPNRWDLHVSLSKSSRTVVLPLDIYFFLSLKIDYCWFNDVLPNAFCENAEVLYNN